MLTSKTANPAAGDVSNERDMSRLMDSFRRMAAVQAMAAVRAVTDVLAGLLTAPRRCASG